MRFYFKTNEWETMEPLTSPNRFGNLIRVENSMYLIGGQESKTKSKFNNKIRKSTGIGGKWGKFNHPDLHVTGKNWYMNPVAYNIVKNF